MNSTACSLPLALLAFAAARAAEDAPAARTPRDLPRGAAARLGTPPPAEPQHKLSHTDQVVSIALTPDGSLLASGGQDGTLLLWDLRARRPLRAFRGHTGQIHALAFSPDGRTLASASEDGTPREKCRNQHRLAVTSY